MAALLFLRKFLKHGRRVGSFAASGAALAKAATEKLDPTRPQTILELGAGTGAVTQVALSRMHPESRLLAIELDGDFARILRQRCPRAIVVHGDAAAATNYLENHGIHSIDVLISGLPLPSLPVPAAHAVLDAFRELGAEQAYFTQLTIMPLVFLPFYEGLFSEVSFRWVLWNLPPAGVYHCRGLRDAFGISSLRHVRVPVSPG